MLQHIAEQVYQQSLTKPQQMLPLILQNLELIPSNLLQQILVVAFRFHKPLPSKNHQP